MGMKKIYADASNYESKLARVMERFGADSFNYDWSRHAAYVEFILKGQHYRFDHSVEKAKARGIDLMYGSDVFAQIVLSLEDLARMDERGIYEIQTWLSGMKFLPPPVFLPPCFEYLGFTELPAGIEKIKTRYKTLSKKAHPDGGGSEEAFIKLKQASEEAVTYLENKTGVK